MNILYTTCFLDVSGVTKINYDILVKLSDNNRVYVCVTKDNKKKSKLEKNFSDKFGELLKLWQYPSACQYRYFVEYLDNNDIKLVFNTHSLWVYEHVAKLKKDRPSIKIIDSLHVLEPYCFRGGYPDISANQFVHPFIDQSIVISEHLLSYIKRYYSVDSAKFVIIRNGIDMNRFKKDSTLMGIFKEEIGVPANAHLIGFIGRFSPQKRPDIFLKIAKLLTRQLGQVYFYMIGEGELIDKSKKLANKLGISDRVQFVPTRDDIHVVLNSTTMLVVTSSYEGAPLTILESLAVGVPVVSANVGAIAEYVGISCLVRRQGGNSELCQFVEKILKRLNNAAQPEFDRQRFSVDHVADSYAKLFEYVCRQG
jgi:glycosyltransferase involved in cell wall biosynthesis